MTAIVARIQVVLGFEPSGGHRPETKPLLPRDDGGTRKRDTLGVTNAEFFCRAVAVRIGFRQLAAAV